MLMTVPEIENVLKKYFLAATAAEVRRAAKSIVEANGVWQEVDLNEGLGAVLSVQCKDSCAIDDAFDKGFQIRVFISANGKKHRE